MPNAEITRLPAAVCWPQLSAPASLLCGYSLPAGHCGPQHRGQATHSQHIWYIMSAMQPSSLWPILPLQGGDRSAVLFDMTSF